MDRRQFTYTLLVLPACGVPIDDDELRIDPIPDFRLDVGETHDMTKYVVYRDLEVESMRVINLTGFARFDPGTGLLTGYAEGVERNLQLEVTWRSP